jgi:hypothetical protein
MIEERNPISTDLVGLCTNEEVRGGRAETAHLVQQVTEPGAEKIFLPRGSAETRFAPPQYYYLASRSGVVPSWAAKAPH